MLHEYCRRIQVVDGDIEKPLYLRRVKIHRDDPVGTCLRYEVRHELRRDRHAGLVLPVLPRVAEIGDDGVHLPRGCPARGVNHDQELEEVLRGRVCRLYDVHVGPTDVLRELDPYFAVAERLDFTLAQFFSELARNLLCQGTVRPAGKNLQDAHTIRLESKLIKITKRSAFCKANFRVC